MNPLLTDLYQLTMFQAYLEQGMEGSATFELFVRRLPGERNWLVAAGLEQALQYLQTLAFSEAEVAWLESRGGFSRRLLDHLRAFRFRGEVHAMPEGTLFFADEPILRVTAPMPQAQLVESRLLNIVHFQTLIASKAARIAIAAQGRKLVDFGMRRAHGAEAALFAARAAYLAGFDGSATVEAGRRFGIPLYGTMAHSFVQAHHSEDEAFVAFARSFPQRPTLLVDTYDTEAAVARLVQLAPQLAREGITIGALRIDSGDLAAHSRAVRSLLDEGGMKDTSLFASGDLDEHRIAQLIAGGAPIDGFGVGTALTTSFDVPALDAVYKLQSYAGAPKRKRSEGKATWPGIKQVCRFYDDEGWMLRDTVQLATEEREGETLLRPVMRAGEPIAPGPTLQQARAHLAAQLRTLPPRLRALDPANPAHPVVISPALQALTAELDDSQT